MHITSKELINRRALGLFAIIRNQLNFQYEIDTTIGSTIKWCYLIIYGPRKYLDQFKEGDLLIDGSDVHNVFIDNSEHIIGKSGLLLEELEVLERHNQESRAYVARQNVVPIYRTTSIGLNR